MGDYMTTGIADLLIQPLKVIRDARGAVMHMLRTDSPLFVQFGEVYFSLLKQDTVKAWKRHHVTSQSLAVPIGCIRLVVYDDREKSSTRGNTCEIITGPDEYKLVRIPPMVWYGFKGIGPGDSLIASCTTLPHDPSESDRVEPSASGIPYEW